MNLNMLLVPASSVINGSDTVIIEEILTLSEVYPGKSDIAREHSLKSTARKHKSWEAKWEGSMRFLPF